MSEAIITAIITGALSLMGSLIAMINGNKKITQEMKIAQAVTDTKLDELTREVREHNNFAQRVPVIEEQIRVANHRIEDLERGNN